MHSKGVWSKRESVYESVIFSEYHDLAISLLVYPNDLPNDNLSFSHEYEDPEPFDSLDQFLRN